MKVTWDALGEMAVEGDSHDVPNCEDGNNTNVEVTVSTSFLFSGGGPVVIVSLVLLPFSSSISCESDAVARSDFDFASWSGA